MARSEATRQSRTSSHTNEIAALPTVARKDNFFLIGRVLVLNQPIPAKVQTETSDAGRRLMVWLRLGPVEIMLMPTPI